MAPAGPGGPLSPDGPCGQNMLVYSQLNYILVIKLN